MTPRTFHSIAVFCGANPAVSTAYLNLARQFGRTLAQRNIRLVYGAGTTGMMGHVAQGVLESGGDLLGVLPEFMVGNPASEPPVEPRIVVSSMHERKMTMHAHADACVALPGGIGTMDEWMEALTWVQLGLHAKPVGLLDADGYFQGLVQWLDRAVRDRFLESRMRNHVILETEGEVLLDRMAVVSSPSPIM